MCLRPHYLERRCGRCAPNCSFFLSEGQVYLQSDGLGTLEEARGTTMLVIVARRLPSQQI